MIPWLLAAVILGLLGVTTALDVRAGEIRLPSRGRNRRPLRRSEYPLIFWSMLAMRAFFALLLLSILTGWFSDWIGSSI